MIVKRSFPPVVDSHVRILVLGSLPGELSLAERRYYAHPRNQFWRLMSAVLDHDLTSMTYPGRLDALLGAGIGLWDVVESASRSGSLDANIREHRPNRLPELIAGLSSLAGVAFNGGKAALIGKRQIEHIDGLAMLALPSSSPAYTVSFEEKRTRWLELRKWL